MQIIAAAMVVLGVGVAGLSSGRRALALSLVPRYLGIALLLVASARVAAGTSVAIVGLVTAAFLWPRTASSWHPSLIADRRWFDLSLVALTLVGAIELAMNHPFLGEPAGDIAIDVLAIGGLVSALTGRELRLFSGLDALILGGFALLVLADPALPRGSILLYAIAQITIGAALDRLWSPVVDATEEPA